MKKGLAISWSMVMRETLPKMAPTTIAGIFFAFDMHPGGLWSGDYIVSPLMDWDESKTTGKRVRMDRVKEVFMESRIIFPLADAARKRETKIKELKETLKFRDYTRQHDYQFLIDENRRLEQERNEVVMDNKKLAQQVEDQVDRLRKSGM